MLIVLTLALLASIGGFIWAVIAVSGFGITATCVGMFLFTVSPDQGRLLQLFGAYRGTARTPGLRWANPFSSKRGISLRVRNFETGKLKVNDKRGNPIEIGAVVEARVSHLANAQEIAAIMLRRQQAAAIVAARKTIVEGAVGMVDIALEMLAKKKVIELDEERKAAMVSNLLVVPCSDQNTQPVANTGSLYH
jgi:regulator of protease activity HflC (stomatin/prohibitin superfamily)